MNITVTDLDPSKFYALTDLIKGIDEKQTITLQRLETELRTLSFDLETRFKAISDVQARLSREARIATRRRPLEPDEFDLGDLRSSMDGQTFLNVLHVTIQLFKQTHEQLLASVGSIKPGRLILSKKRHQEAATYEDLQHMMYEFQLNQPTIVRFVTAIGRIDAVKDSVLRAGGAIMSELDRYQALLVNRHSVEGIEIHDNPVATDVAMAIYENVDGHGEIAEGKDPKEVSAYTINKAIALADAVHSLSMRELIADPSILMKYITETLRGLWSIADAIQASFKDVIDGTFAALGVMRPPQPSARDLESIIQWISDLDPREVQHKKKDTILSREEKFNLKFKNETLQRVAHYLTDASTASQDLVDYILQRKAELRKFFQEENSFYVCKVGQGNPFTGEAPGALTVIPGPRPLASIDAIRGSGFDEVRDFFSQVEHSAAWHDLFVATSPSKTADKSNVLLVGPQGCGKTEVLRAVGGDKKSIGIFAQASDFLTCWKGEAEKNPKRLFEEGVRLQRESKRHVHFLIDEIDAVLNSERGFGSTNLTLEFQILMDGVVSYPHLSVWGTTNNPERIPMPMIRRFNKVLIVGELDVNDRVALLKSFLDGFMPTSNFEKADWHTAAMKLDGATGDVIRKVIDHIWREKMTGFVRTKPDVAKRIIEWLNRGQRFQVSEFTASDRCELKTMLRDHVTVTPLDLMRSIAIHLDNVAVISEIETARSTYAKAKKFLAQIKS